MMTSAAGTLSLGDLVDRAEASNPRGWSPQRDEAWWWLAIPVTLLVALPIVFAIAPDFYRTRILPEGYGVLEVLHFLLPMTAAFLCFGLLTRPVVRAVPLLFSASLVFGLACFFIGGEEHSWGQHLFKWSTPEYWAEINRQNETNLHNTSKWFNQIPEKVLQIGILVGGILLPLLERTRGRLEHWFFKLFVPPQALLPVALAALVAYAWGFIHSELGVQVVARSSEAAETFYYMFLLFYVIAFRRRIAIMDRVAAAHP